MLGGTEILVIGGIIVLLFGAGSIPKLAKSLGQAKREFRKGLQERDDATDANGDETVGEEKE